MRRRTMGHARWGAAAVAGAAAALALAAPANAQTVPPAADWWVQDTDASDYDCTAPEPTVRTDAAESAILDATSVKLVGKGVAAPPHYGTSIETPDLGIDVATGDPVTVEYELDGADPAAGAVRLFIYDHADADTDCEAPTQLVAVPDDGSAEGTLTLTVGFTGTIGTAGLVYDSSNGNAGGSVIFSNLTVAGQVIAFAQEPPAGGDGEDHEPPDGDSTCELVDQLEVADEHGRDGYDRDLFGGYDRDALLAESMAEYGDYYSFWDNQHYDDPSEVDVDHTVALAEAWDSGAHAWSEEQRDKFAADPANLTLLTDNLNASKGDRDIAEWLPPYEPHRDEYVLAYVGVKAAYNLTIDPAEQAALRALAEELGLCQAAGNEPSTAPPTEAEPELPVTGSNLPVALGGAAVLLGLTGGGLMALARRRRTTFRAE